MAADKRPLEQIFDPRFDRKMNVYQRLHLAMTLADYVQKEKKDGMRYTIVSHDRVTALAREIFVQVGLIYWPLDGSEKWETNGNRFELKLAIRIQNIDNDEDNLDVLGFGYGIDPGDKGPGKATSYAVKYALLKALGLETGDDPDQDQDVQHRSSTQQRADELSKAVLTCTSEDFRGLIQSDTTRTIIASLTSQSPADARVLRQTINKRAKELEIDMKAWQDEPA